MQRGSIIERYGCPDTYLHNRQGKHHAKVCKSTSHGTHGQSEAYLSAVKHSGKPRPRPASQQENPSQLVEMPISGKSLSE